MGAKYSVIDSRKFLKILKNNGYEFNRQKGDHKIFVNSEGKHISINANPNPMVIRRLIKENSLKIQ